MQHLRIFAYQNIVFNLSFALQPNNLHTFFNRKMSIDIPVQTQKLLQLARSTLVPKLSDTKHKGQYGRIGVVGGSFEYTGAPYFAASSALRVGADLSHVFCQRSAAVVIKSYSPELIVHPVLDDEDALAQIEPWLERLHVLVIGPGLGREPHVQNTVIHLLEHCQKINKPLVIDADGLAILNDHLELLSGMSNVILTPNAVEFKRLFGDQEELVRRRLACMGTGVVVLEKAVRDKIHIPGTGTSEVHTMPAGGSGRRCGGQGDLLSGAVATFYHWALESNQSNPAFLSAFCASYLVKECNAAGFAKHGRSMLASDMLKEIAAVFKTIFECSESS